jgi:F-type H+-transporting ATPase subunit epsilon
MPLHLEIVTPEKKIFSDTVENVILPGADGELGILPEHAGLVTALQAGELVIHQNGSTKTLAVGSGFAEVDQKKVIVLTDSALGEDEIDEAATEAAMKRAEEQLAGVEHSLDAEEVAHLQNVIAQATAALSFKRKHRN